MKLSRRAILTGGAAAAATTLPLQLSSAAAQQESKADPRSGESLALARYVANTRYEDLPADVVAMTKRAILDAVAGGTDDADLHGLRGETVRRHKPLLRHSRLCQRQRRPARSKTQGGRG